MQESNFEHNTNFHHIVPTKIYWRVFWTLMVLTALTVYTATKVDLGWVNVPLALTIATVKASLVVLFFMHVKYSGKLVHFCIISGILFFILMVFGTLQDFWTRENVRPLPAPGTTAPTLLPGTPEAPPEKSHTPDQVLAH